MENKKIVVSIGRQYGSGGEIGTKLAQKLGVHCYDKNILRMTSDQSGIKESYFHLADEKAGNKLLYKIINSMTPEVGIPSFGADMISADYYRYYTGRDWEDLGNYDLMLDSSILGISGIIQVIEAYLKVKKNID